MLMLSVICNYQQHPQLFPRPQRQIYLSVAYLRGCQGLWFGLLLVKVKIGITV